jgi:hypothetical protein
MHEKSPVFVTCAVQAGIRIVGLYGTQPVGPWPVPPQPALPLASAALAGAALDPERRDSNCATT